MPTLGLIILILLVALPLLEIAVLIKVGALIGIWLTLAIILLTGVIGLNVLRHQGPGVARRFAQTVRSGEPPVAPMAEAMLLMFAGGCLIAPGLITDAIGLLLLVPPVRIAVARWAAATALPRVIHMRRRRPTANPAQSNRPGHTAVPPVIEGEYERLDEHERPGKPKPPSST
jgi:UPF0716 protein FxsA